MKLFAGLVLVFLLCFTYAVNAQTDSDVVRIRTMKPVRELFDNAVDKGSFGLTLGIGEVFHRGRVGFDIGAFADLMNYNFDIDNDKRFRGSNLCLGPGVCSRYCFNPQNSFRFSVGLLLKVGYNWGTGDVYKYDNQHNNYGDRLEDKSIKSNISVAVSPFISLSTNGNPGPIAIELGYDSANYARQINNLRSAYYSPLNYHSGYLFVGIALTFGH
jgi:hypothetical protein